MARITDEERARFHKYLDAAIDKLNSPKNCQKPHWSTQSTKSLLVHFNEETKELNEAIDYEDPYEIIDESNDVINIALMIIDNNRG